MDGLTEKRWRRYGKDRVYVSNADGTDLGYVDLQGRAVVAKELRYEATLVECLSRWCLPDGAEVGAPRVAPEPEAGMGGQGPTAVRGPVGPPDLEQSPSPALEESLSEQPHDLVANVPGSAARARREAVNAEAPFVNFVARVLGAKTDERSWRVGAKGEEKVAKQLAKLGDGWHCLHTVPVGENGADIDHVVIGPPGVFTVNAKRHPGGRAWIGERMILVNGHRTDYVRNSRFEARRSAKHLTAACGFEVSVTPVIAFVDLDDLQVKQMPTDVHVTSRRRLARWLRSLPSSLDAGQVDQVFAAARRSTTWRPKQ